MLLIPLTPAQSSFVEVELLGRFLEDEDDRVARVMDVVLDHFQRSRGTSLAVPDAELMQGLVLSVINFIDDEIEEAKSGDDRALSRIGGVETIAEARNLRRAGSAIWQKLLKADQRYR